MSTAIAPPECPAAQADAPPREPHSRRALFRMAAAAAAVAGIIPGRARAQGIRKPPATKPVHGYPVLPNETPVAPVEWATDTSRLLRRITYGITDADVAAARKYGFRGFMERQLDHTHIDDSAVDAFVAAKYPLLSQTTTDLFSATESTVTAQLQQATLYRAAFSNRQLYERMVEFWSDHFNISISKVSYLKIVDDRDVIRRNALTTFRQLLYASAKSGAMMAYLDQNQSRSGAPNQNYAREIMELHTLGVDGGYTQADVAELSRVFTGWTIAGRGDFSFNPAIHDWGAKTVLGVRIPAGSVSLGAAGLKEGELMLDTLLAHPSTASFISTKMLRWFLTYDPTPQQVSAVAAIYTSTGGNIKSMIRAVLDSAWLVSAPMKLKRPFHLVASSMRTTTPTLTNVTALNNQLFTTGQSLFVWDTPDGYPDKVEYWAGNILPRWNFGAFYAALAAGETIVDVAPFMVGNTADLTVSVIDKRLFGGEIAPALRTSLAAYLKAGTYNAARVRETLALAIGSNSFQWY
ncbi:MAG: hypothetical protein JWM95_5450 [Gemmatimonadetes bacterium]|nr:hypothetical protein [Gemmatimonadota bacterium]